MTKADRERMSRLKEMPCVCCRRRPVEIHHIVDKGYRKHSGGHQATIPLCVYHHRGVLDDGWTAARMAFALGPSMALSKREFNYRYGGERALLDRVNRWLMGEPA
jgi:hypothetical protein